MKSTLEIQISTNDLLNNIEFSDIFNLEDIQHLQDLFADANGVASIITHVDGTPITNPSNFCRLCRDIIRSTEKGFINCMKSDAALGLKNSSGPVMHQCLNGGLWDSGARITVGAKHIANWIIGQVRNEELDIHRMITYADEIGVNREVFLDALNEVPVMSVEQLGKLSKMLFLVANEHSERAYNNWLLKAQIAEREKTRVLLEESENRFQVLFNIAPFGYQSLDFDGHFIEVNQSWINTLGYTQEEVTGKWFGDFLSPASREEFHKRFQVFKAEGKIHSEFEMIHKNGRKLDIAFEGKIGNDLNGKFKRTHCILQDITESKREEKRISESEKMLREAQHLAQMGSWDWTIATDTVKWSEELYRINGRNPDSAAPSFSEMSSYFMPESWKRLSETVAKAVQNGEPYELELEIVLPDGTTKSTSARGEADCDANGKITGLQGTVQDITQRKRVEDELKRKNEELVKLNSDKDRFMSILGHDLKSPFNSILGFLEILSANIREYDLDTIESQISIVETSAKRVFSLLEDLLLWSRSQSGQLPYEPQRQNLTAICQDILSDMKLIADTKNIIISDSVSDEIAVYADTDMLKTVLRNLISNAIKYSNAGGQIEINTRQIGSETTISVSDTGVGMAPEVASHLFEISQIHSTKGTANETGTGLGLLLCKEFVAKHGGNIWVESEVGKGSTFYFSISSNFEPKEQNIVGNRKKEENQPKKLNILIADDDDASEQLLTIAMEKFGGEVLKAKTGIDAVEVCLDNPDVDLVLMDIQMPVMNGYEATRQIRLFNKKVIIIAETAFGYAESKEEALKAGCNDYLQKPIKRKKLIEMVEKYF